MDLDSDGNRDLISGSWPGEIFFFRGDGEGSYEAPEMLRNAAGDIICIGGGIEKKPDGSILITGNGEFENVDGKSVVRYHDQVIENTNAAPISITGTASAAHAVDWDDDGDQDLLVGDIRGRVFLMINESLEDGVCSFAKESRVIADGREMEVEGDAGPWTADWDGDGDFDLLVGAGDGSVSLFENVGEDGNPEFKRGVHLVGPARVVYGPDAPREARRGSRSKVCTADWNGDGLLDLLVGDFTTQKPDLPEPTAEEQAEYDQLNAELDDLQPRYRELIDALFRDRTGKSDQEIADLNREYGEISTRMSAIREKLPPEYENHGWVWLFLRKDVAATQD